MTNDKIAEALTGLFEKQRIVFWYDTNREFRPDFDALDLPGVEKIELANNEFGVKHRVLRGEPDQRFLLFRDGPEPDYLDNWLLDVQLASGTPFRTDQASLWLTELDLGPEHYALVKAHSPFFEAAERRNKLSRQLAKGDSQQSLKQKMLAVCASCEPYLEVILESLLAEFADEDNKRYRLMERCHLHAHFWEMMQRRYGYKSEQPTLKDFILTLFSDSFYQGQDSEQSGQLNGEALVFMQRWKDSRAHTQSFETLSADAAELLQIHDKLHQADYRELLGTDEFEAVDQKILSDLVRDVVDQKVAPERVEKWARKRRTTHWFSDYQHAYAAIETGSRFIREQELAQLDMTSLADGVNQYTQTWYKLDQLYRKFYYHKRQSGQSTLLQTLTNQIENRYTNNYLLPLNSGWQRHVDACARWEAAPVTNQRDFFQQFVKPYLKNKTKVCVLISDAMRYEVGEELQRRIRRENRFDAELKPALACLPSYTQLGMASLLPHGTLGLAEDGNGDALVDNTSATGRQNRGRILSEAVTASQVVRARDLLAMNKEEARALFRDNEVVYVYHNQIDQVGDARDSEERVFDAAEDTLEELVQLTKKLTNANARHLLVTADHGFLYQDRALQESDFLGAVPGGKEITYQGRRFVMGRGLEANSSFRTFQSSELGLEGSLEVQIPKSINRLRQKGSGSRFVHGGATLQEVVIPVLRINKSRRADTEQVEVELVGGGGRPITTGQMAIKLYQSEAVTEKRQPRTLRVGLYAQDGQSLSEEHDLAFDMTSENPRDRETDVRLILSRKADEYNNQEVELRLREPITGASHFQTYKSIRFTIRRSFTNDFDL